MLFTWNEDYSVEVPEIDAQHKHFLELANVIITTAEKEGVIHEELVPLVKNLNEYALYHLTTEERYFAEFQYEGAAMHIEMHNVFRTQMHNYEVMVDNENNDAKIIAKDLALFAGNWLQSHIIIMDKKYSMNFHEHGLGASANA